jgi:hypothetical protein
MQVQYRENKGGFECIHLPSIDLSTVEPQTPRNTQHNQQSSFTSGDTSPMTPVQSRPSIVKKASKLSFGMKREKGKEREQSIDKPKEHEKDKETLGRPSGGTLMTTASSGSSSFFNVSSNHTVVAPPESQVQTNGLSPSFQYAESETSPPRSHSPAVSNKGKVLPPIPRDFATRPTSPQPRSPSPLPTGAIDKELFDSMGNNSLSVRFEINIVKVRPVCVCICKLELTSLIRCLGSLCTEFNSVVLVETAGNTKC